MAGWCRAAGTPRRYRSALHRLVLCAAIGIPLAGIGGCSDDSHIARLTDDAADESPPPPEHRRPRERRAPREPYQAAVGGVPMLAVREFGFGRPDRAQRSQDLFVGRAADLSGWKGASVHLESDLAAAAEFIQKDAPHFGFLTESAFEALRGEHAMESLGNFEVRMPNRYHLVSNTQSDVAGCRGRSLATDHDDAFETVDRAAAGAFQISDFEVVITEGPRDTMRALEYGKAECVLIGDGQLRALQRRDREKKSKVLWSSKATAPGVVVAFPSATDEERTAMAHQLGNICAGRGQKICGNARVTDLRGADTTGTAADGSAPEPPSS